VVGTSTLSGFDIAAYDSGTGAFLTPTTTQYIGLGWCAGDISATASGTIMCDGSGVSNVAQTDSFTAALVAYAEQTRNNASFSCDAVDLGGNN
jgi:hypothetical protein